jgi:hypothetical protein
LQSINLLATLLGHLAAGPLWITSIATFLMVMTRLPLAFRSEVFGPAVPGTTVFGQQSLASKPWSNSPWISSP